MTAADRAAREGALLIQRPDWGTLDVSGGERLSWLQGLVTCDVGDLSVGVGRWGLVLTKPGKIQTDVIILSTGDRVLIALPSRVEGAIAQALARFLVMEDAEIEVASARHGWAALHGPHAVEVAAHLAKVLGGHSAAVDVTGLGGAVIAVPPASLPELESAALSTGRVVVGTPDDWARLRVERLVPELGVDMGPDLNPHEASLDRRTVSFTKGCYLGQEAVCMQDMRGRVKRRLVLLRVEGAALPAPASPVTTEGGSVVGRLTHAVKSDILGGVAALALVATASADPGTALVVGAQAATVVAPAS